MLLRSREHAVGSSSLESGDLKLQQPSLSFYAISTCSRLLILKFFLWSYCVFLLALNRNHSLVSVMLCMYIATQKFTDNFEDRTKVIKKACNGLHQQSWILETLVSMKRDFSGSPFTSWQPSSLDNYATLQLWAVCSPLAV